MAQQESLQTPWWYSLRWRKTSHQEAIYDERNLLSFANTKLEAKDIFLNPATSASDQSNNNKKADYLHTIQGGMENIDSPNLVYVPGYGAGAGFLFRAMQGLTAGFRFSAIDSLGTGLSSRPKFTAKTTEEAEDFFVDSLEQWRQAAGLDKIVLLGHSMGGYISACYALKYPQNVQHLIMVCPAGVGRRPKDWQPPEPLRNPWTLRGQLFRLATAAWEGGITPGSIIRTLGPFGKRLVEGYTRRRFQMRGHHLSEEEASAFEKYMYHVLAQRGSGEFALNRILEPFAYPRKPLEDRLHELKVPLTFIYGEFDWMDPKAAARVCNSLASEPTRVSANSNKLLAGKDRQVIFTPNAGHYPYIDQPGVFIENVIEACEEYLPAEAVQRMREAAAQHPFHAEAGAAMDTKQEMEEEMASNPAAAETKIATDM